jgi:hypothetical protein
MKVGFCQGQGSLLLEESCDRRQKTLKKHPLPFGTISNSYTQTVFGQRSGGAQLSFQVSDKKCRKRSIDGGHLLGNTDYSLLLHHSSDLEFLHLVFPDQTENCVNKRHPQYSLHCIYPSYDYKDPNPCVRANPRASLMNLKLLGIHVLRTNIANKALSLVRAGFFRKRPGMSLPLESSTGA